MLYLHFSVLCSDAGEICLFTLNTFLFWMFLWKDYNRKMKIRKSRIIFWTQSSDQWRKKDLQLANSLFCQVNARVPFPEYINLIQNQQNCALMWYRGRFSRLSAQMLTFCEQLRFRWATQLLGQRLPIKDALTSGKARTLPSLKFRNFQALWPKENRRCQYQWTSVSSKPHVGAMPQRPCRCSW